MSIEPEGLAKIEETGEENERAEPPSELAAQTDKEPTKASVDRPEKGILATRHRYNPRVKSSLVSPLKEYGLLERKKPRPASEKRLKTPKLYFSRENTFEDEDNSQKKHNLQIFDESRKIRDYFYNQYMDLLEEKIHKQRENIKKKEEIMVNNMQKRLEKEREEKLKLRRKAERHTINHDENYLQKIPKSDAYKVVQLQKRLQAAGDLRTRQQVEEFWQRASTADFKRTYLRDKPVREPGSQLDSSSTVTMASHTSANHFPKPAALQSDAKLTLANIRATLSRPAASQHEFRPMTQITEAKEVSRPGTVERGTPAGKDDRRVESDTGATSPSRSSRNKKMDPSYVARVAAQKLEWDHPQMEVPELTCFTMDLDDDRVDPVQVLMESQRRTRDSERKSAVQKRRGMYQLSVSNGASAQRLLDKHVADLDVPRSDSHVSDWLEHLKETMREKEADVKVDPKPWMRYINERRRRAGGVTPESEGRLTSQEIAEADGERGVSRHSRVTSGGRPRTGRRSSGRRSGVMTTEEHPPEPSLLTYEELAKRSKIVEAKCLSTFWTNYAVKEDGRAVE